MAERIMKWILDEATGILTCKHKDIDRNVDYNLTDLFVSVAWEDCDKVEKYSLAYSVQQKLADHVAGKGKKAGYTGAERIALMNNKWQSMTVDRTWSEKGGPREKSIQTKLKEMKVISLSMAKAAPLMGLKVDPAAKILSDEDYQKYLEEQE